jgi:hypothetical protein
MMYMLLNTHVSSSCVEYHVCLKPIQIRLCTYLNVEIKNALDILPKFKLCKNYVIVITMSEKFCLVS